MNEIENRRTIEKIIENKNQFFEKQMTKLTSSELD